MNNQLPVEDVSSPSLSSPDTRQLLLEIYDALEQKNYHPVKQIVGYLLTEDPTYITNYNRARALISRVDRDDLLREIVGFYFEQSGRVPKKHPQSDTEA